MKTLILSLMLLGVSGSVWAKAKDTVDPYEKCRHSLIRNVNKDKRFFAWDQLPSIISRVDRVTLIGRLSSKGAAVSVEYERSLVEESPAEGFVIPPLLNNHVDKVGFVFVAHADRLGLEKLYNRIDQSTAKDFAGFRLLQFSAEAQLEILTPSLNVFLNDRNEQAAQSLKLALDGKESFEVKNLPGGRSVYFLPRAIVEEYVDPLEEDGVKIVPIGRPIENWEKWLRNRAPDFGDPVLLLPGKKWSVLSSSAFLALQELNHIARMDTVKVSPDEDLTSNLKTCYGITCDVAEELPPSNIREVTPAVAPPQRQSAVTPSREKAAFMAKRKRIAAYFKERGSPFTLSAPGELKESLLSLDKEMKDPRRYRAEIRALKIGTWDYQVMPRADGKPARDRLDLAWKIVTMSAIDPDSFPK